MHRLQLTPLEDEMNTQHTPGSSTGSDRDLPHEQGLRRPAGDQRDGQALDDVGLDDLGMSIEDEIRGHRGSGVTPADDVRSDNNEDERHERR
jgi:hypothetical protein